MKSPTKNKTGLQKMVQCGMESEHRNGDTLEVRRKQERSYPPEMCRFLEALGDVTFRLRALAF